MEQTYEYGVIVGTKREREHWKNKIMGKIEKLTEEYNKTVNQSKNLIEDLIDFYKISAKLELLKELLGDD